MKRRGFTLIEVLIVIGMISILIGILLPVLQTLANQAKARDTRQSLEAGKNLLANWELSKGSQQLVPSAVQTIGDVSEEGAARRGMAVQATANAIAVMSRNPDNKRIIDELPASRKMKVGMGVVLLDGWRNPIIFLAPQGLSTTVNGASTIVAARDGKGFWASAGPDGDFSKGDDNMYSGEN